MTPLPDSLLSLLERDAEDLRFERECELKDDDDGDE